LHALSPSRRVGKRTQAVGSATRRVAMACPRLGPPSPWAGHPSAFLLPSSSHIATAQGALRKKSAWQRQVGRVHARASPRAPWAEAQGKPSRSSQPVLLLFSAPPDSTRARHRPAPHLLLR